MGTPLPDENEPDDVDNQLNFTAIRSNDNTDNHLTFAIEEEETRARIGSIDIAQNAVRQYDETRKTKSSPALSSKKSTISSIASSKKSTGTISSAMTHTLSSASKAITNHNEDQPQSILTLNLDQNTDNNKIHEIIE